MASGSGSAHDSGPDRPLTVLTRTETEVTTTASGSGSAHDSRPDRLLTALSRTETEDTNMASGSGSAHDSGPDRPLTVLTRTETEVTTTASGSGSAHDSRPDRLLTALSRTETEDTNMASGSGSAHDSGPDRPLTVLTRTETKVTTTASGSGSAHDSGPDRLLTALSRTETEDTNMASGSGSAHDSGPDRPLTVLTRTETEVTTTASGSGSAHDSGPDRLLTALTRTETEDTNMASGSGSAHDSGPDRPLTVLTRTETEVTTTASGSGSAHDSGPDRLLTALTRTETEDTNMASGSGSAHDSRPDRPLTALTRTETEVTTTASGSGSALDSEWPRCVMCGMGPEWTPRVWECDVCGDYFLCENCHKGSQDVSEVLSAAPQVHNPDHHMSPIDSEFTCDGCGSDLIWNRRWHCKVCHNFDLCEACHGGLDAMDMPLEHLKEHPMIAFEVICSDMLPKFRPNFTKPLDPQWSYRIDNNDMARFGFVWEKRKPVSGMLNGMDDAIIPTRGNAVEDNSISISKILEEINPQLKNLSSKQASPAIQMNGMLDKKHKVFLSHAGTEKDFVEQLYRDLSKVHHFGIFFDKEDDSLPIGEPFPNKIFDAAKHCELAVVVISHEYFIRKWPMLELAAFVHAQKTRPELKILPIFYRLSVEEFKKRQKSFIKTWSKVGLVSKDEVDGWKEALKVISRINGLEYNKKLGEPMFRDSVVEAVYKRVNPELMWDDSHVQGKTQMQERVQKVIQMSRNSIGEVAMMCTLRMGLFGMGGCGKTTMCKVLGNQMMPHYFGKVCHIEFGGGDPKKIQKKLLKMRMKLLQSLCELSSSLLETMDEEMALPLLKTHIPKQRVCLLIDNVSDNPSCIEEARTLLDLPFKDGSLIVVTSRSSMILETLKIERRLIMKVPSLTSMEAKALFSHHAGCDTSALTEEQMKAMESFVERCNFTVEGYTSQEYHPLALKVLGSRVGPNPERWQNVQIDFKYYENENMHPVFSILRSSFDTLNLKYQRIFLDLALANNDYASLNMVGLRVLVRYLYGETDEQFSFQVVEILQAKSLVDFYDVEPYTIYVHDLYREFARMEVEKMGLQHSSGCCFSCESMRHHVVQEGRVRIHDHPISYITKDILSCTMCMKAEMLSIHKCANLVSVDVPGLETLRVFHVLGGCPQLTRVNLEGAVNLRSFDWGDFEGKFYPDLTSMESLEVLSLTNDRANSFVALHGCLDFSKNSNLEQVILSHPPLKMLNLNQAVLLKVLYLHNCEHLESLVGLEALGQLRRVILIGCFSLVVFPSLANFPSLEVFFLHGASKLKVIQGFASSTALRVLSLKGGRQLDELPGIEGCLKLSRLFLSATGIGDCSWISMMKDLTIIDLGLTKIRFVPDCSRLYKLFEIWLDDCQALESIGDKTRSSPATFPQSLRRFSARNCVSLNALPEFQNESTLYFFDVSKSSVEDVSSVRHCKLLETLCCVDTRITSLPDLSSLTRLMTLDVSRCKLLTKMDNIKSLPALKKLWVFGCTSLLTLPNLLSSTGLTEFSARKCVSLNALPKFHSDSTLYFFNVSRSSIEDVSSVRYCKKLETLCCANTQITSLPDLSSFTRLMTLDVSRCKLLTKMDNIKSLPALIKLCVSGCTSLLTLPDLRSSTRLTELYLWDCPLLDPNVVKLVGTSIVHMVMDDVPDYNQSDNDVDAQECDDESSVVVDFQALEPTHSFGRCTTLLKLVAVGGLLAWWLGRRHGKHKSMSQHELGRH